MSPNNQINGENPDNKILLENLRNSEGYYKWFLEVQSTISDDSVDSIHSDFASTQNSSKSHNSNAEEDEESDEGEEETPLAHKRRIEKVKKYLTIFSDSDVLLELLEDERRNSEFAWKFNPLETFSVLGALGFFNSYLNRRAEAIEAFEKLVTFLDIYERISSDSESTTTTMYLIGMKSVVWDLKRFYSIKFDDLVENIYDSKTLQCEPLFTTLTDKCDISVVMGIKNYFLGGFLFPELFLTDQATIVDQMIENDPKTSEWHMNRYNIKRFIRLQDSQKIFLKVPSAHEKSDAESALKINLTNPFNTLALCQYLTDFLNGNGPNGLVFGDMEFQKHTDIVTFITDCASEVSETYPTFLRAQCTFAEMFANELPITRQDRDYAKSLLDKALKANPNSSKINHKVGLCLMKCRQFQEAQKHFSKSIELDPSNATAQYTLIKLLLRDPIINKELLDKIFNTDFVQITETLGPENQLSFWKASYFFITGDKDLAVDMWVEVILEFYVVKPELDLETVLPFTELPNISYTFFWTRSPLNLKNAEVVIRSAISKEKTRRRVVLNRLLDLVTDALENQQNLL